MATAAAYATTPNGVANLAAAPPTPKATAEKKYKPWVQGAAGGLGSAVAKSCLAPIQRLTVFRQLGERQGLLVLAREVVDFERMPKDAAGKPIPGAAMEPASVKHLRGFFRGNLISILQRIPYSGVQLMIYDRTKTTLQLAFGAQPGDVTSSAAVGSKVLASAFAAGVSGAAVYPMDVVRTRIMSRDPECKTIQSTFNKIYGEYGFSGFYKGLTPSLVQRVPDIVINLTVYESVFFACQQQGWPKFVGIWAGGAAAALVAIACTFPLDVVKRRVSAGSSAGRTYNGPLDCAKCIMKERGVAGLYAGAHLEAMRCVPQVILMWSLVEALRTFFDRFDPVDPLPPQ